MSAYWKLGEKLTLDLGGCPHMWGWCTKRGLDLGGVSAYWELGTKRGLDLGGCPLIGN